MAAPIEALGPSLRSPETFVTLLLDFYSEPSANDFDEGTCGSCGKANRSSLQTAFGLHVEMNRIVTNFCRFLLDDCIPSPIRDSKMFMYPLFFIAYRGKQIDTAMNFKSLVHTWTEEEYATYYRGLNSMSRNRGTDLSKPCVREILDAIPDDTQSVFDMGCGHGLLLRKIGERFPQMEASGCDLKLPHGTLPFTFYPGDLFHHSFPDNAFDVVTCCHTLEHLLKPERYVAELKRITRRKLIIVVPRQRYRYYTLDEHVNFFAKREDLTSLIGLTHFDCKSVFGDWLFVGDVEAERRVPLAVNGSHPRPSLE